MAITHLLPKSHLQRALIAFGLFALSSLVLSIATTRLLGGEPQFSPSQSAGGSTNEFGSQCSLRAVWQGAVPEEIASAIRRGDPDWRRATIPFFDRLIARESDEGPRLACLYNARGSAYYALKQHDRAESDLLRATALDLSLGEAWYNLGLTQHATGQYEESIASHTRAMSLMPRSSDARVARGNAQYRLGRADAAIADYDEAIALKPQAYSAYYNRGRVRADQGRFAEALEDMTTTISLSGRADYYYSRGLALSKAKRHTDAIEDYNAAIRGGFRDSEVYFARANSYFRMAEFDQAVADYSRALAITPGRSDALINRAAAFERLNQPEKAIADYLHAERVRPGDPLVRDRLQALGGAGQR